MWKFFVTFLLLGILRQHCAIGSSAEVQQPITSKSFQMHFLNEITNFVDETAQRYLNQLLESLRTRVEGEAHAHELAETQQSPKLEQKIVFIKQILDECNAAHEDSENFYALRNVNFLKHMKHKLQALQAESAEEIHNLRVYQLCKQFHAQSSTAEPAFERPYSLATLLAPITSTEQNRSAENHTLAIDLPQFGRNLYENINGSGADIIDDYLTTIRKLLHEVIDEKPEHNQHEIVKLKRIIHEIDLILDIPDFYEKRSRVYAYLQSNLTADYEQFKGTQQARLYLEEILLKLKIKGLDLFFAFLFSNFEFLERLHEEWSNLLPPKHAYPQHDEDTLLLYNIIEQYENFKRDPEKYETYMQHVKKLREKTSQLDESGRIFELHHNAVKNMGSVTLNMLRVKCDEI